LDSAGLELACQYGDFDCGPLTGESANQICLVRSRVDILAASDPSRANVPPAAP
jgi:hypothetical protein